MRATAMHLAAMLARSVKEDVLTMGLPKGVNNIHRLNLKGCAAVFREHRDHGVQHDASLGQVGASTFYEDISCLQRDLHAASLLSQRPL